MKFVYYKSDLDYCKGKYEEFEEDNCEKSMVDFFTDFLKRKKVGKTQLKSDDKGYGCYTFLNVKTKNEITLAWAEEWDIYDKVSLIDFDKQNEKVKDGGEKDDQILIVGAKWDKRAEHISKKIQVRGWFSNLDATDVKDKINQIAYEGYVFICTTTRMLERFELKELIKKCSLNKRNDEISKLGEEFTKEIKFQE